MKANMPRVKAVIWDFFTVSEDSDKFASCSICKDLVSRGGSCVKSFNTTNLIDHLKKKHPGDYVDYEEKKKIRNLKEMEKKKERTAFRQLTMLEAETKVKVWDINDPHAMRIHKLVGEMIATDNQPFQSFMTLDLIVSLKHWNQGMCYLVENISRKVLYHTAKTEV